MIKVFISGRVVNELELQSSSDGKEYVRIRVASKKRKKDAEGKIQCDFVDIAAFGEAAKCHCKNLKKGSVISAVCDFDTNYYIDKNGEKRYGYSFYADSIDYQYSPKNDNGNDNASVPLLEEYPFPDDVQT